MIASIPQGGRVVTLAVAALGFAACGRDTPTPPSVESAPTGSVERAERQRKSRAGLPEPPPPGAAGDAGAASGAPSSESLRAGDALAAEIKRRIQEDPQITSKNIEVAFVPGIPSYPYDSINLSGTASSEDEKDAIENHAHRLTDTGVGSSISVSRRSGAALAAGDDGGAGGVWTDPGGAKPAVPLCAGLTVVTAVASQGDYESIKTIESVTPEKIRLRYSFEGSEPWWSSPKPQPRELVASRTILPAALESGRLYQQIFVRGKHASEAAPGTTAIGTSAAVLRDLKAQGRADISICLHASDGPLVDENDRPVPTPAGCTTVSEPFTLTRVGNRPVPMRVLVDGVPTDLPAVQARGKARHDERVEFFFLDDEKNPLTLAFRLGIGKLTAHSPGLRAQCELARKGQQFIIGDVNCDAVEGGDRDRLRVIKISTQCAAPALKSAGGGGAGASTGTAAGGAASAPASLEQALAEQGTVDVYSIYFSFNSDRIREESEPTLKEISEILKRRKEWQLGINGHTDSVASDSYNLELSRRRAEAVKRALVTRFGVAAARLDTAGAGEASPKDTNDTLEGRARNRRVELIRR